MPKIIRKSEEMAETLQEFSLVCQPDFVFCDPGDDVVLSCHLQPAISAVSMEIKWQKRADIICHYKDGEVTVSGGYEDRVTLSLQDLHNGNVSLTLKNIRTAERGIYICRVINKRQARKEYVILHVSSENFRLVAPHTISAVPGENVTLPVNLLPEISAVSMTIKWLKGSELIYEYKFRHGTANSPFENRVSLSTQHLERGNLSLILRNVQQSDSGDYTCRVVHDGSVTTTVVHLQVSDMKCDLTEITDKHLREALRHLKRDCLSQEWEKTLPEALEQYYRKKKEKKETDDSTVRRRGSMEGLPPLMEDIYEGPLERYRKAVERYNRYFFSLYDPTARLARSTEEIPQRNPPRRRSSMEGIPPLMERESSSPNSRAESLIMRQEAPSPATLSEDQPGERTESVSAAAAIQPHENPGASLRRSQISVTEETVTRQDISSSAVLLQGAQIEITSQVVTSPQPIDVTDAINIEISPILTMQGFQEINQPRLSLQQRLSILGLQLEEMQRMNTVIETSAAMRQTIERAGTRTSQSVTSEATRQTIERAGTRTSQSVTSAAMRQTIERAGTRTSQSVTSEATRQTIERAGTRTSQSVTSAAMRQTIERAGTRTSQSVTSEATRQTIERAGTRTSQSVTSEATRQTIERAGTRTSQSVTSAARSVAARPPATQRRQEHNEERCQIL